MILPIGARRDRPGNNILFPFRIFLRLPSQLTRRQSFTLIEILMVIIILGLVAGLAAPNFNNTYLNFQLKETADNIASLMRYAQSRAVVKGKICRLQFDIEHAQYRLTEADFEEGEENAESDFQPIPGRFGKDFSIPEGITIETESPYILFFPDGKIDQVRVYLHNQRDQYLTISTKEQIGYVQVFEEKI